MLVLIPLPLFFASTVFGVGGLTAWVVIGIFWCFCSAFTVVLYPLWESRAALAQISRGILKVRQFLESSHAMLTRYIFEQDIFAKGSGKHIATAPSSGV